MPGEDRYAALKDLDSLMKSQQQQQQQQQQKAPEPVKEWNPGEFIKQYIGLLFTLQTLQSLPVWRISLCTKLFETDKIQSMS